MRGIPKRWKSYRSRIQHYTTYDMARIRPIQPGNHSLQLTLTHSSCVDSIWDGRYFKVSSDEDNYNKTTHWNLGTILNFNLLLLLLYINEFLSFLSRCDYEIKSLFWNLMSKAVNDLCLKKLKNERKKKLINIFGKGWDSWKWETEWDRKEHVKNKRNIYFKIWYPPRRMLRVMIFPFLVIVYVWFFIIFFFRWSVVRSFSIEM